MKVTLKDENSCTNRPPAVPTAIAARKAIIVDENEEVLSVVEKLMNDVELQTFRTSMHSTTRISTNL